MGVASTIAAYPLGDLEIPITCISLSYKAVVGFGAGILAFIAAIFCAL